jgi:hypothetical protein
VPSIVSPIVDVIPFTPLFRKISPGNFCCPSSSNILYVSNELNALWIAAVLNLALVISL